MQLTADEKDVLAELVNIGFSRTAASLSELTGHRVLLDLPEVSVHPIGALEDALGRFVPQNITAVHQIFKGPVSGDALLLFDPEGAAILVELLSGAPAAAGSGLSESGREVLAEVGNILLNACLGMFGNLLNVQVSFAVPQVELTALTAMMRSLIVDAQELTYALVVATRFRVKGSAVEGFLIIVLGVSSMERLLAAVNTLHRDSGGAARA